MFFKELLNRIRPAAARDYVLVAGAAHIDVLADYALADEPKMDKVGSVRYSTGGTAYNIAINLAQNGIPVSLLTVLKRNSFSSTWIQERLAGAGVRSEFVQLSDHLPESGFVGLRADGILKSAVTSTAVGEYTFQTEILERAIERSRLVAVDCNLAVDQISLIVDCARRRNRPVVIAAVSDSKVGRILQLEDVSPVDIVVLNDNEARAIIGPQAVGAPQDLCARLHAKCVILTQGHLGYEVLFASGAPPKKYAAPQIERIVSRSGAGDALISGVLAHWYKHQRLDFDDAKTSIANSIRRVLQQPGATLGSLATDIDFSMLARIAIRNEPIWKRFLSPEMGVATSIIVAVLTVLIVYLTYKLLPSPEPKPPSTGAYSPEKPHRASPPQLMPNTEGPNGVNK